MNYIGNDREEEAIGWAAERLIGGSPPHGFCRAFSAVGKNEEFVFVVVLSNFTPTNIDVNLVSEIKGVWSKNEFLDMYNSVFGYAFDVLGAQRLTGLISSKNIKARRFSLAAGFKSEGLMRKAFKNDDLCIYGLLAEEFRSHPWYRGNYGHPRAA